MFHHLTHPAKPFLPISHQPKQNLAEGGTNKISQPNPAISDQMYHPVVHHSHVAVSLLEVDDGALREVERDLGHGHVVARRRARPAPRRTAGPRPGPRSPPNRTPRALFPGGRDKRQVCFKLSHFDFRLTHYSRKRILGLFCPSIFCLDT